MNSNGTMFGMCNPEAAGVAYGHHPHHQSQHYASSDIGGSPGYCGTGNGTGIPPLPNSESPSGLGYGLHTPTNTSIPVSSEGGTGSSGGTPTGNSSNVNNNRSNSVEASGGQNSPTGIISENGLHYANLDGSGGPPGAYPGGGYGHHPMGGYHYSDIHNDGSLAAAAAVAASGGQAAAVSAASGFSAYLENSSAAVAAYAQSQYPSIYGQHHGHALKSIRGPHPHDFNPSSYPAEFAAAAAVSKPAPAVPTYKWMQVKRNVPKPGRSHLYDLLSIFRLKKKIIIVRFEKEKKQRKTKTGKLSRQNICIYQFHFMAF